MSAPALPLIEGILPLGPGDVGRLTASGPQSLHSVLSDMQLACIGRLRFRQTRWADLERSEGLAAALSHAWHNLGEDLPGALAGEYAIALWDRREHRGLVAVDRFSTQSIYIGSRDGCLAFSTRPARVAALLGNAGEVDPRAILAYVYFHAIPAPLSILRGVRRLDVGEGVSVGRNGWEVKRHWTPEFLEDEPFDFRLQRESFFRALEQGVAECAAGVPRERLGCFLSGGTDSSTIAGLVTRHYGAPARTFSIGFDVGGYDERRYSRLAASHFGTDHVEHVLTPEEAERTIDVLATTYEQPFGNSSAVPTYVCARLAREAGIERMLGGDGGDELYGGNERYATQWKYGLYARVPSWIRDRLIHPMLTGPFANLGLRLARKARNYVADAEIPLPDRLNARYNLLNVFGVEHVLTPAVLAGCGAFRPLDLEREIWEGCGAGAQINRLLAYDFKFTLGDNDLVKVTRMCHAAGVQVSYPMLADAVVDLSLRLPPSQKLHRWHLRWFFRQALRGFLPDEIIDKPKHGFGMPFGDWLLMQPRLARVADDALSGLASRGYVRPEFIAELRSAAAGPHPGYYGTMVWVLMILELWMRSALDRTSTADAPGATLEAWR